MRNKFLKQDGQAIKIISLKEAILTAVILDFFLLLIASSMMDTGQAIHFTFSIVCGHWAGNLMIIFRRLSKMTKNDKDFIRFGALFLMIITLPIAIFIYVNNDWFYYTFQLKKLYRVIGIE